MRIYKKYHTSYTFRNGKMIRCKRIYKCVICRKRLKRGIINTCSNECRLVRCRELDRVRYHRVKNDKRYYIYRRKVADMNRNIAWNKLSEHDKIDAMLKYNKAYLKSIGGDING